MKADKTLVRLVEAVTLLLGEEGRWDLMREALYVAAAESGHLRADEDDCAVCAGKGYTVRDYFSMGMDICPSCSGQS